MLVCKELSQSLSKIISQYYAFRYGGRGREQEVFHRYLIRSFTSITADSQMHLTSSNGTPLKSLWKSSISPICPTASAYSPFMGITTSQPPSFPPQPAPLQINASSKRGNYPTSRHPHSPTSPLATTQSFNQSRTSQPPWSISLLGGGGGGGVDTLPLTLTHLSLGRYFNQPVNNLPPALTHLSFVEGWDFNQNVDSLPARLTHLFLATRFNQPENLPPTLVHLTFGVRFNQPVNYLPSTITHLTFATEFNQQVNKLPLSLSYHTFGVEFNQTVDSLPPLLTHLTFGERFDRSVDSLPATLIALSFEIACFKPCQRTPIQTYPPYLWRHIQSSSWQAADHSSYFWSPLQKFSHQPTFLPHPPYFWLQESIQPTSRYPAIHHLPCHLRGQFQSISQKSTTYTYPPHIQIWKQVQPTSQPPPIYTHPCNLWGRLQPIRYPSAALPQRTYLWR